MYVYIHLLIPKRSVGSRYLKRCPVCVYATHCNTLQHCPVCVYVSTYTYMFVHAHVCKYAHTYRWSYVYRSVYIHLLILEGSVESQYLKRYPVCVYAETCTYMCVYARVSKYTHTYRWSYIYIYIYIHFLIPQGSVGSRYLKRCSVCVYADTRTCMFVYAHMYANTHTFRWSYIYVYISTFWYRKDP